MTVQVKGSLHQDPPLTAEGQRLVSEGSHILKCPLKSQIPILGGRGGAHGNLMRSSNLLKSKIPMLMGRGLMEFDAEFKFAKIQNSHVEGGWGGGGLVEFDAEFKFAKIQNSHVEGGGGAC